MKNVLANPHEIPAIILDILKPRAHRRLNGTIQRSTRTSLYSGAEIKPSMQTRGGHHYKSQPLAQANSILCCQGLMLAAKRSWLPDFNLGGPIPFRLFVEKYCQPG